MNRSTAAGATLLAGATTTLAAGYWTTMSSQSQLLGAFPNAGTVSSGERTIALTFDDGPNEPYTSQLADLLAERGVPATFFQVGRAVSEFPEASRALVAAGHVVGDHSFSHDLRRCYSARLVEDEIERAEGVFGDVLQLRPRLFRPPWLARSAATFRVLGRRDMQAVSGTFCHPFEVAQIAARRIANRAISRARPGRMIIFHDGYNGRGAKRQQTLDAVARTVDGLGEQGWSFTTVDTLLGVSAYDMVTGRSTQGTTP